MASQTPAPAPNLNRSMADTLKDFQVALLTKKPGTQEYANIQNSIDVLRGVMVSLTVPNQESTLSHAKENLIASTTATKEDADNFDVDVEPEPEPEQKQPSPRKPPLPQSHIPPIQLDEPEEDTLDEKDLDLEAYLESNYGRRWDSYSSSSQIDDDVLAHLAPDVVEWIRMERAGARELLDAEREYREEVEKKREETERRMKDEEQKIHEAFMEKVHRVETMKQLQESGMYTPPSATSNLISFPADEADASASHLLSRSQTPSASSTCDFGMSLIYPKQDELDALTDHSAQGGLRYPATPVSESSVSATHHSVSGPHHSRSRSRHNRYTTVPSPFLPPTNQQLLPQQPPPFPNADDYPVLGGPQLGGPLFPPPAGVPASPQLMSTVQPFPSPPQRNNGRQWRPVSSTRYALPPSSRVQTSGTGSYADQFKKNPRGPSPPGYYGDRVFLEPDERRRRDIPYSQMSSQLPSSTSQSVWDSSFENPTPTPEFNLSPPNPTNAWFVNNDMPYVDRMPERSKSNAHSSGEDYKLPVEVQVIGRSGKSSSNSRSSDHKSGKQTPWKIVGQRAFANVLNRMHGRQSERRKQQKQQNASSRQQKQQQKNLLKWYQKRTSAQQLVKQQERRIAQRSKQNRERHRQAMIKKGQFEERFHAKASKHRNVLREHESDSHKHLQEVEKQRNMRHARAKESLRKRHARAKEKRERKAAAVEAKRIQLEQELEQQKLEEERRRAEKRRAAEARRAELMEGVKMSVEARTRHVEAVRKRKRKGSLKSNGKGKNRKRNNKRKKNKTHQKKGENTETETDLTTTTTTATTTAALSDEMEPSCSPPSDNEGMRQNIRRTIAHIQNELLNEDRKDHVKLNLGREGQSGADIVHKVKSLWHRTKSQVAMILGRPEFRVDYEGKVEHVPFDEDLIFEPFRDVSRSLHQTEEDLDAMPLTCRALALRCCVFVTYLPLYSLKTSRVVIETLVAVCQSHLGMETLLHRCAAQILEEFIFQVQAYIRTPEPILRQKQNITGLTRIVRDMFSFSPNSHQVAFRCETMQILLIRLLSSSTFWMKLGTACQRFIGSPPSPELINEKSGELIRLMRCGLVVLACTRRYRHRIDELDEFITAFHSSNGGGMFWLLSNLVQCAGQDSNPLSIQSHLPPDFAISDEAILVASCALEFLMEAALIRGDLAQRLLLENEGESFHTLTILTQYCCSKFDLGSETLKQLTFNLVGFLGCCALGNTTVQEMFQWGRTTNLIDSLVAKMPFFFLNSFRGQMVMIPTLISVTYNCPTNLALLKKHLSVEHILKFMERFLDDVDPKIPAVLSSRYVASDDDKEDLALRIPREKWHDCVSFYQ